MKHIARSICVAAAHATALACLLLSTVALGDELSERVGAVTNPRSVDRTWVADPKGVIARRRADINQLIDDLERKTSVELAVVIVPTIGQLAPKDFAVALFSKWGIGKTGKDNGVLVLHVLDQRDIQIETGYGMEGILPDAKCHWITQEIAVPFFRRQSFSDGHYEVVRALVRAIENPNISRSELVGSWSTEPGAITEALPKITPRDEIALRHASAPENWIFNPATALAFLAVAIGLYAWIAQRFRSSTAGASPYEKYNAYAKGFTRWQYAASVPAAAGASIAEYASSGTAFAAAPALLLGLVATFWRRRGVLRRLRAAPRICGCGKTMRRLSEQDDDAALAAGNVVEEQIGSMEYDVWMCDCGKQSVEVYAGRKSAQRCPQCSYKTLRQVSTRVLRAPTTSSTGLREVTFKCANCRHSITDTSIIPQVSTASGNRTGGSSGASSGGSRGGGSFGGGRSGGGGAGSRY